MAVGQIDKAIGSTTEKGLNIVGYGVGLLLWVVGVMFFTLNMRKVLLKKLY